MTDQVLFNTYDIFISYRRDGGDILAKLLYESLKQQKYSVFFDHESLSSGVFGEQLLETVRNAKDVIVVLSKGCLERCKTKDDWMLKEIAEAIKTKKNIIPVFSEEFKTPTAEEMLEYPIEVQKLISYQGYTINVEHYDNTLKKISHVLWSEHMTCDENDLHNAVSFLLKNGTNLLSEEEKRGLMYEIISSYHGNKISSIMSSFLNTVPKHYNNIRVKFNYEISLDSSFRFGNLDIDSDKYFKLGENFSYQKHLVSERAGNEYWISFVRDLDQVDESLRNENFIFSENLLMDECDLQTIANMSEEEQKSFYTKQMRVRFNLNGKILEPKELIFNKTGIFAKYESNDDTNENSIVLDVKIAFTIPQRKTFSYFFVSLSDPTYSPHIVFSYPEDEINVEMISFMNRNITTTNAKVFDGLREITMEDEWILPMSGVVFIITPQE